MVLTMLGLGVPGGLCMELCGARAWLSLIMERLRMADGGLYYQNCSNYDTEYVKWNMIETLNVEVCSQNLLPHAHKGVILEWNMPRHHEEEEHS